MPTAQDYYWALNETGTAEKYFDPKSTPENPRWIMVDVKFKKKLKKTVIQVPPQFDIHTCPVCNVSLRGNERRQKQTPPVSWL